MIKIIQNQNLFCVSDSVLLEHHVVSFVPKKRHQIWDPLTYFFFNAKNMIQLLSLSAQTLLYSPIPIFGFFFISFDSPWKTESWVWVHLWHKGNAWLKRETYMFVFNTNFPIYLQFFFLIQFFLVVILQNKEAMIFFPTSLIAQESKLLKNGFS